MKQKRGFCARPGCTRPLVTAPPKTMPKSLRPMFMAALLTEEYCSTQCCRADNNATEPERREYLGRREHIVIHGTTAGYAYGCSCEDCRAAEAEYQRDRREKRKAQATTA